MGIRIYENFNQSYIKNVTRFVLGFLVWGVQDAEAATYTPNTKSLFPWDARVRLGMFFRHPASFSCFLPCQSGDILPRE